MGEDEFAVRDLMIERLNIGISRGIIILMMLCCIVLPAASTGEDQAYPRTVTDSAGREISLQMPVERIIVLNSDAAEAVAILGAADKVIGISDSIKNKPNMFPELAEKQSIGKWNDPDYELIGEIAREGDAIVPDLIVIGYTYPDKEYGIAGVQKGLSAFEGIRAVGLDFYRPENMTREIRLLGDILGREEEAVDFVSWYDRNVDAVKKAVAEKPMPRVYVEWSSKGGDLTTMGKGSGLHDMLRLAGGYNIASSLADSYPKVDWEWVVSENPEIIIRRSVQSSADGEMGWAAGPSQDGLKAAEMLNGVTSRAAAQTVDAVAKYRVYVVNWEVMAGLDDAVGLTYLAKILHPEIDLDPLQVHREYLAYLGLELPQNRMLVYP